MFKTLTSRVVALPSSLDSLDVCSRYELRRSINIGDVGDTSDSKGCHFFFRKQAWDKNCHVYDLPCSKDLHHGFSKNGTDVFGVI